MPANQNKRLPKPTPTATTKKASADGRGSSNRQDKPAKGAKMTAATKKANGPKPTKLPTTSPDSAITNYFSGVSGNARLLRDKHIKEQHAKIHALRRTAAALAAEEKEAGNDNLTNHSPAGNNKENKKPTNPTKPPEGNATNSSSSTIWHGFMKPTIPIPNSYVNTTAPPLVHTTTLANAERPTPMDIDDGNKKPAALKQAPKAQAAPKFSEPYPFSEPFVNNAKDKEIMAFIVSNPPTPPENDHTMADLLANPLEKQRTPRSIMKVTTPPVWTDVAVKNPQVRQEKKNLPPQTRATMVYVDLQLPVPAFTAEISIIIDALEMISKNVDPTFRLYMLKQTDPTESNAWVDPFNLLPNSATVLRKYMEGFRPVDRVKGGRLYLSLRIGVDADEDAFLTETRVWISNKFDGFFSRKCLQHPDGKTVGWIMNSDRDMCPVEWAKIFAVGMAKAERAEDPNLETTTDFPIGLLPNKPIWDGVLLKDRKNGSKSTPAVHIVFRAFQADRAFALLSAFLQSDASRHLSNVPLALIKCMSRTTFGDADKDMFSDALYIQKKFLEKTVTSSVFDDIAEMDRPIPAANNQTLREIIMGYKYGAKDNWMFIRANNNPGGFGFRFTHPDGYGGAAIDRITCLGAFIKHQYGDEALNGVFHAGAKKRFLAMKWDEATNRPISDTTRRFNLTKAAMNTFDWMEMDKPLRSDRDNDGKIVRPTRGSGDSLFEDSRAQLGKRKGNASANDDDSSIESKMTAATTNSTRVKLRLLEQSVAQIEHQELPPGLAELDPALQELIFQHYRTAAGGIAHELPPQKLQRRMNFEVGTKTVEEQVTNHCSHASTHDRAAINSTQQGTSNREARTKETRTIDMTNDETDSDEDDTIEVPSGPDSEDDKSATLRDSSVEVIIPSLDAIDSVGESDSSYQYASDGEIEDGDRSEDMYGTDVDEITVDGLKLKSGVRNSDEDEFCGSDIIDVDAIPTEENEQPRSVRNSAFETDHRSSASSSRSSASEGSDYISVAASNCNFSVESNKMIVNNGSDTSNTSTDENSYSGKESLDKKTENGSDTSDTSIGVHSYPGRGISEILSVASMSLDDTQNISTVGLNMSCIPMVDADTSQNATDTTQGAPLQAAAPF